MRKYTKALVNLAIALAVLLLVIFLLPKVLVFFLPFVIGWIIALIASPLVRFLEEKVKIKRKAGSAFVIILVIALVVLLLYVIGNSLAEGISGLIEELPDMWAGLESDLVNVGQSLQSLSGKLPTETQNDIKDVLASIADWFTNFFGNMGTPTIEIVGNIATQLPTIFIGIIMALLSSYFFVADRVQINDWFRAHTPASIQMRYQLVRQSLSRSIGGYFKAQLKIEFWMYLLLVAGLGILGIRYFWFIAIGVAFLDFLPFFGTGTALCPWAVVRALNGDYKTAIGLLIIWGGGQLVRQLIQPKIVGDSMGVAPLPTLILLFVGFKVGGVFGMIIAVPLGILVYSLYEEGVFETTKESIQILAAGINSFRRFNDADRSKVEEMRRENDELQEAVEEKRAEVDKEKEEEKLRQEEEKQLLLEKFKMKRDK